MARWGSQLGLLRYLPSRLYVPNANLSSSDHRLYQRICYIVKILSKYVK